MKPFGILLLSLLLLPGAARAVLPGDNFERLDLTIQARRDMQRAQYDPGTMEAAAERQRQEIEAAMSRPPQDAPLYDKAIVEARNAFAAAQRPADNGSPAIPSEGPRVAEPGNPGEPLTARLTDVFIFASVIFLGYCWVTRKYGKVTGTKARV